MKRLAAVAVVLALCVVPACAQRGGSHGGFSGGHGGGGFSHSGGFSGGHIGAGFSSHGGFSGGHQSFTAPRGPSFQGRSGTFLRGAPPRAGFNTSHTFSSRPPVTLPPRQMHSPNPRQLAGPSRFVSQRMPYPGRGIRPLRPTMPGSRQGLNSIAHRMPYHSPHDGGHGDNGWNHRGGDRDHGWDRRDHDRDRDHRGFGFYGLYGWAGYPYYPWGWGYPFLLNDWGGWGSYDDYDSQPAGNYAASQYPEYTPGPDDEAAGAQPEPQRPEYTPWPYSSPAPSASQSAPASTPAPAPEAPVTLVFKDGRPNEKIHNYMLTARTLSVLDQRRREIPVEQLDLTATARVNREAGVDFSVPPATGN